MQKLKILHFKVCLHLSIFQYKCQEQKMTPKIGSHFQIYCTTEVGFVGFTTLGT